MTSAGNGRFTFSDGQTSATLAFDPAQGLTLGSFGFTADGSGGTDIYNVTPLASLLGGLGDRSLLDTETANLFGGLTLTDDNSFSNDSVTVTWNGANGALSDGATIYQGSCTIAGAPDTVQATLQNLVFTPTSNQVPPGQSVTTGFTLTDTNAAAQTTVATENVAVTSVNDPPTIAGTVAGQTTTETTAITPFANVILDDIDFGAIDSLTITLSDPANGILSGARLGSRALKAYTLSPQSARSR